ncbi:hypothetical protein [Nocardia pseudobrasiliensis]|uniref:Uncharacterized protein n=1 Tax=Nocardia pseudobrasiliensis TaxID=45979 RepID=A0A370I648_9NOCA|nr:hypothetical protein [Nocardia pseudobrasiliensis]RDI64784.1 hypothetical protein DFR76_107160 [Nocardia pseudobrasiliensis]
MGERTGNAAPTGASTLIDASGAFLGRADRAGWLLFDGSAGAIVGVALAIWVRTYRNAVVVTGTTTTAYPRELFDDSALEHIRANSPGLLGKRDSVS